MAGDKELTGAKSQAIIPKALELPHHAELDTAVGFYSWLKKESGLHSERSNEWAQSAVSRTAMNQWFDYYDGRVTEVEVGRDIVPNWLQPRMTARLVEAITEAELAFRSSGDVGIGQSIARQALDALKQSQYYIPPNLIDRQYQWYDRIDNYRGPISPSTPSDKAEIELYTILLEGFTDPVDKREAVKRLGKMGSLERFLRRDDLGSTPKLLRIFTELRIAGNNPQRKEELREAYNKLKETGLYNRQMDEWNLFQTGKDHYYPPYLTPQLVDVLVIEALDGTERARARMDFLQQRYQRPDAPAGMWIHTNVNAGPLDRAYNTIDQMLLVMIKNSMEPQTP